MRANKKKKKKFGLKVFEKFNKNLNENRKTYKPLALQLSSGLILKKYITMKYRDISVIDINDLLN